MRHQQRPRAGIEERSRQPRQRFGTGLVAGNRIAGRQHHPIGIELQLRDFARGEQAVVELGWLFWNAQHQRWFGKPFHVAGNETVRGEIDDALIGERRSLQRGFAGVLSEVNIGSGDAEVFGDRVEFVGGVGQLRERL